MAQPSRQNAVGAPFGNGLVGLKRADAQTERLHAVLVDIEAPEILAKALANAIKAVGARQHLRRSVDALLLVETRSVIAAGKN